MLMMSIWIQDKFAALEPLSSALFCLWLSLVGVVPTFFLGIM
ncbi:MAG: hypothetical protein ABI645_09475 [Pseudomonadota bacterium]